MVRLQVNRPGDPSEEIAAAIDTGFTGFLALPTDTIVRLGLQLVGARRGRLADGSLVLMPLYLANVLWDGVLRRVQVLETGGPCLIGVSLLYGYVLTFEAITCLLEEAGMPPRPSVVCGQGGHACDAVYTGAGEPAP
jgi:clan AA aspartic protease